MKVISIILFVLAAFATVAFAAGSGTLPNAYCNQQTNSCFMQCCSSIPGGHWDYANDDCMYDKNTVPETTAMQACGSCVDQYAQCDATYNGDGSLKSGGSSSGGCCGSAAVLLLVGGAAFVMRN